MIRPSTPFPQAARRAFTLVELLVVIGIIALLVGILIPVAVSIRGNAQTADTKSLVRAMENAAQQYYSEFQQYPGPLDDAQIGTEVFTGAGNVTGAENFVLGTMGGLYLNSGAVDFDVDRVGSGPVDLSGGGGSSFPSYLAIDNDRLSQGNYSDDAGDADDSDIPEVLDGYSNPLPILYLRANRRTGRTSPVASDDPSTRATYYVNQVVGYTAPSPAIGVGRAELNDNHLTNGQFHGLQAAADGDPATGSENLAEDPPYDAEAYLTRPGGGAVNGDSFVLISAGPDRVYGTKDDITNFDLPE